MFKENQRMDGNFKYESREFKCIWDDINKLKKAEHKQVQIIQRCTICSKTLLQSHELETQFKEDDKAGKYICGVCGKVFRPK